MIKIIVTTGEQSGPHTFRNDADMLDWLRMYDVGKQDYVYA